MNPREGKEVSLKKEDVANLLFLVAALLYFAGHVVWAMFRSLR